MTPNVKTELANLSPLEINNIRRSNRAAIIAHFAALPIPPSPSGGASAARPQLLTPTERAALVAAEMAKPKPDDCCG